MASNLKKEYLAQYGNGKVFVETGTFFGETVTLALEAGYKTVYTIELNSKLYGRALQLFSNVEDTYGKGVKVNVMQGDSYDRLTEILNELNEPATFWLDAHASAFLGGGKAIGSPLLRELEQITQHPCKEHTILIDDKRLFSSDEWHDSHITEKAVLESVMKINPNYKIHYLDGTIPQDIICATLR